MKSRFFFGMFVGFFLACVFFFGVMKAKAQTYNSYDDQVYQSLVQDQDSAAVQYRHVYEYGGRDDYRAIYE